MQQSSCNEHFSLCSIILFPSYMFWIPCGWFWISVLELYFLDSKAKDSGFPYMGRVFKNPVISLFWMHALVVLKLNPSNSYSISYSWELFFSFLACNKHLSSMLCFRFLFHIVAKLNNYFFCHQPDYEN